MLYKGGQQELHNETFRANRTASSVSPIPQAIASTENAPRDDWAYALVPLSVVNEGSQRSGSQPPTSPALVRPVNPLHWTRDPVTQKEAPTSEIRWQIFHYMITPEER